MTFGFLVIGILSSHSHVYAAGDMAGLMPTDVKSAMAGCRGLPGAVGSWLSLASDTQNDSTINLPYGTPYVDLSLNLVLESCTPSHPDGTWFGIISSNQPSLVSQVRYVSFLPGGGGTYNFISIPIRVYAPTNGTFKATAYWKAINKEGNNYQCVTSPGGVNSPTNLTITPPPVFTPNVPGDFNRCGSIGGTEFSINFSIPSPPYAAIARATCNNIDGWAFDWNLPLGAVQVDLYIDGIAPGNYNGRYTANLPDSSVNAFWHISGDHGFSIPVPAQYKYGNHTVYMYVLGVDSNGNYDNIYKPFDNGPQSYTSCPAPTATPSCVGITFDQTEYGTPGTLTTTINNPFVASGPPDITITSMSYSATPAGGISPVVDAVSITIPNDTLATPITHPATFLAPGTYNISVVASYTSTPISGATVTSNISCLGSIDVSGKPYLKVYGGDVIAGGGYNNTSTACTPNALANIYAFASGSGSNYRGSSGQLGVMAPNIIQKFFSASNRTAGAMPPQGLTFANTNAAQVYGGSFGSGTCITDYYNMTQDSPISTGNVHSAINASGAGKSQYSVNSGVLGGGSDETIRLGHQLAIYANGDIYIDHNIIYDTNARASTNDIPYFALIVQGNIYISPAVTRLDGLYVAEPSAVANTGRIYTCAPAVSTTYNALQLYANCSNPLAINGALIAQQVRFLRTINSLKDSTVGEVPNFADGSSTKAAEVINFTPEMYLAPSPLKDPNNSSGSTSGRYDAIYSLQPIY